MVKVKGRVAKVLTVAFHGAEVIEAETQMTIGFGLPAFTVVRLPDWAAAEARDRAPAALASLGLGLPPRRITVNLGPAKRSSTLRSAMPRSMRRSSASYPDNSPTLRPRTVFEARMHKTLLSS
jgi:Subunit ChlI of Mg-chelatase